MILDVLCAFVPWVYPAVLTWVSPWQELMEQSHSPSRGDGMPSQVTPKWPTPQAGHWGQLDPGEPRQSYSNVPGQTGVDPGKLNERTRCLQGMWSYVCCFVISIRPTPCSIMKWGAVWRNNCYGNNTEAPWPFFMVLLTGPRSILRWVVHVNCGIIFCLANTDTQISDRSVWNQLLDSSENSQGAIYRR